MGSKDDDDDHHRKFGNRHRLMISAILTLFAVTIIVFTIHFFLRYRRRHRRRESPASLIGETHQIERVDRDAHTAEQPKSGMDPLAIATVLPESVHKRADDQSEAEECSICLSNIEEKAAVRLLPNCKHIFHVECIDMWLHSNTTCPTCRTVVEPRTPAADSGDLRSGVQPTAPPVMREPSSSRLSSFRRALSRGSSQPVQPTAPPLMEEQLRVNPFRRMLSRERSLRVQSCGEGSAGSVNIERH